MLAEIRNEVEPAAVARHVTLAHDARPRHVLPDQLELARIEQPRVVIVGQHRKERLLVRDLAAQRVRDGDRARRIGVHERAAVARARGDVVDEHTAVDEIDGRSLSDERLTVVHEIARVGDHGGHAERGERVAQQLELAPRRHVAPVHDGDARRLGLAAPVAEDEVPRPCLDEPG